MKLKLYTTHCPKCQVLSTKLSGGGFDFEVIDDTETMINIGIMSVPMLDVDGELLDFKKAVDWINGGGEMPS